MIAYIVYKEDSFVLFTKPYSQRILHYDIYFNKEDNFIFRIDDTKYIVEHELAIAYKDLWISFSMFDEGYNIYHKYHNNHEHIRIGNSVENDIWIQDKNAKEIVIDLGNNVIHLENQDINYDDGYVLVYLNLRLTIHNDFIMCNSPSNIYCNLSVLEQLEPSSELLVKKNIYIPVFKSYFYYDALHIKLKQPHIKPVYEPLPLKYMLIPSLLMALASLINGVLMTYNALLQQRSWLEVVPMLVMPMCMFISSLCVMPLQRKYEFKQHQKKLKKRVDDFSNHLHSCIQEIEEYKKKVDFSLSKRFLPMDILVQQISEYSDILWSKQANSKDYLVVSLGKGQIVNDIRINELDIDNTDDLYPIYQDFKNKLNDHISTITIDLKKYQNIAILSSSILDYIILQLSSYFHMADLNIACFVDKHYLDNNPYLRCLPHTNQLFRYLITNQKQLDMFNNIKFDKYVICIIQDQKIKPEYQENMIYINIYDDESKISNDNDVIISHNYYQEKDKPKVIYNFDYYELNKEKFYLQLTNSCEYEIVNNKIISLYDVLSIYHINDLNILKNYEDNNTYDDIKAILGYDNHHRPIYLDLSEKAQGSHGIVAGSTGSGKSELLISYISCLCTRYSYKQLQFVLIDFKGAGLIHTFDNDYFHLPHLVGTLSNLSNLEINRCLVSLKKECEKRQKLFKKLANIINEPSVDIDKYQRFYSESYSLEYLAHIVIIVDEFAELKQQYPEFIAQLISIARIGRSLGIHLILATQKPAGVIDDQIWSNCHFHISLKVQSKQDSLDVIGSDVACMLKHPGSFYLNYDQELIQGRSGYGLLDIDYLTNKNKVEILDETKTVIKSTLFNYENKEKQINAVLNKIKTCCKDVEVANLWQKPLVNVMPKDVIYYRTKGVLLGLIDDYYQNKHRYFYHNNKPLLVGCDTIKNQKKFINMYLYNLMKISCGYDNDVYIFDLNNIVDERYKNNPMINVYGNDEEIIENFYRFIAKRKKLKYLIITNLQLYLSRYNKCLDLLYDILNNHEIYNIRIVGICNKPSLLYSKIFASFPQRITIGISDENELINIFNTSMLKKCNLNESCLVKDHQMLNFSLINIDDNDIDIILKENIYSYKNKGIKHMPKTLYLTSYKGNCPTIGISYVNYEYVKFNKYPILILGNSKKVLKNIQKILSMQAVEVELNNISQKVSIFEASKYHKNHDNNEYQMVIWVGKGFTQQFIIQANMQKEISNNEGYIIVDDNIERIRLIEK